jgi:hypothetical protein
MGDHMGNINSVSIGDFVYIDTGEYHVVAFFRADRQPEFVEHRMFDFFIEGQSYFIKVWMLGIELII